MIETCGFPRVHAVTAFAVGASRRVFGRQRFVARCAVLPRRKYTVVKRSRFPFIGFVARRAVAAGGDMGRRIAFRQAVAVGAQIGGGRLFVIEKYPFPAFCLMAAQTAAFCFYMLSG